MFVSDLRHFLDVPDDAPGPARRMADHLGCVVRAATAGKAGTAWESALRCNRRPGNRPCPGHIAVFRADLPAPIDWRCTSCGDDGVISGWEDSYFDLRTPRAMPSSEVVPGVVITDAVAATLRDLRLLDSDCERLVFQARISSEGIVLPADEEDLDELIGFVAAEANHETSRRRQKRLDVAFAMLSEALSAGDFVTAESDSWKSPGEQEATGGLAGRWRILEMDLWDREALDLVSPAFMEFSPDGTGRFGFIAVNGWMDCRQAEIDGRPSVEFTWDGSDEGDHVSGRGWATIQNDGSMEGHIYIHRGDDSGFCAKRVDT